MSVRSVPRSWSVQRRERESGGVGGIQLNSDTTGKLPSAHSTHRADGTSTVRSQQYIYSPSAFDQIEPRMELPAAGEHVFAVEGIEKKRIRKVKRHEASL